MHMALKFIEASGPTCAPPCLLPAAPSTRESRHPGRPGRLGKFIPALYKFFLINFEISSLLNSQQML
jgi:hypothetical protein